MQIGIGLPASIPGVSGERLVEWAKRGGAAIRDYYAFSKSQADDLANNIPTTPAAVRQIIQQFADIGTDEFILWPCIADLDQIDRLEELIE